jgi:catechol 2,3-dioxygenase-like lactoylglutathione lyase family enzyme
LVSIVVRDYDEALAFYVGKLGFSLIEDTYQPAQDKRWSCTTVAGANWIASEPEDPVNEIMSSLFVAVPGRPQYGIISIPDAVRV